MGEAVTLPDPELSNLAEIESAIKEAQGGMNEKEKLASFIVAEVGALWPCLIFEITSCRILDLHYEDINTCDRLFQLVGLACTS